MISPRHPRNPWNTEHFTAGSSSGTGAEVAAGMILGGIGTDTRPAIDLLAAMFVGLPIGNPSRNRPRSLLDAAQAATNEAVAAEWGRLLDGISGNGHFLVKLTRNPAQITHKDF